MNYHKPKTLECALLIILTVASALQLPTSVTGQQPQSPVVPKVGSTGTTGTTGIAVSPPSPLNQGKASGEDVQFKPDKVELKAYLYSQSLPGMWLVFKNTSDGDKSPRSRSKAKEAAIKVQLSFEAKKALADYWKVARDHAYHEKFADKRDVQKGINMDVTLIRSHVETVRRLEQIRIAAPDGERLISRQEATELVMFAHFLAIHLMDRAKEHQNIKRKQSGAVARHLTSRSRRRLDSMASIIILRNQVEPCMFAAA